MILADFSLPLSGRSKLNGGPNHWLEHIMNKMGINIEFNDYINYE